MNNNLKTNAFSMIEVVLAIVITVMAVLPMIKAFSQSYSLSSKQIDQENALKIAESAMNKLMVVAFSDLNNNPETNPGISIPFEFQTQNGLNSFSVNMRGSPMCGTGSVSLGKTIYEISVVIRRIFSGPNASPQAINFAYHKHVPDSMPPVFEVASYSCPDDALHINVNVKYSGNQNTFKISSLKTDLRK
ncbi:MAG: hypothetical protein HQM10_17320 [Candidatus Riflebacteria bacterium]|nr:hypothetical protein [Candidatus Riflebacteria bacterium]